MIVGILLPIDTLYQLFHVSLFMMTLLSCIPLFQNKANMVLSSQNKLSLLFAVILALYGGFICGQFIENGMISTASESDVKAYVADYNSYNTSMRPIYNDHDMGWQWLIKVCHELGLSVEEWFLVIRLMYIGCLLYVSNRLMRRKEWIAMLFFVNNFIFIGSGANGIRNGLALSLILPALVFLLEEKWLYKIVAIALLVFAYSIHNSALLPITVCIVAYLFRLSPKISIVFWLISIPISLITGNEIANVFAGFGFDNRMLIYLQDQENESIMNVFSHIGFRWDFLLYSAAPIVLVWYLTIRRDFKDKMFNLIANTYILSNAFWVMVIRAAFSNRFASLSWFLYPLVLAYPLLRFKIWEDQDRKAGLILLAYASFTFLMYLRG